MYAEKSNDKSEIKILKALIRGCKDARMKLRYEVILLYLRGYDRKHIASIFGISYHTVRLYELAYEESGADGLVMGKSTGRTRRLSKEQETYLYNCIKDKLPKEVGFEPFVNWTAPLACGWVEKEFGIKFSERGMRNVFERLELSYTRPTYTLKKADPEKQEDFKKDFEDIKKLDFRGD